jgi:hypothetical protein
LGSTRFDDWGVDFKAKWDEVKGTERIIRLIEDHLESDQNPLDYLTIGNKLEGDYTYTQQKKKVGYEK